MHIAPGERDAQHLKHAIENAGVIRWSRPAFALKRQQTN